IHSKQISGHDLQITDSLARHIGGALRYKVGEKIFVVDEQRVGYTIELVEVKPNRIVGKILEEKKQSPIPSLNISLGQAILKGKKMDWILQKATELGVSRVSPLVTERTVVEPKPERIDTQHRRWKEILKEAAQQTGRWEIPELNYPVDFSSFVKNASHYDLALIPWEGENQKSIKQCLRERLHSNLGLHHILVLIGPEGGFSGPEAAMARKHQIIPVTLGWRILRAETACLATLTMLQYELGDMSCE
ncbi:MAG: 16S rRNA (uracil(1498)-N(3))-methyltransferase, partial [Nitrospira sp.]|nr:16S rRNA (uracil(1498)-N(3))-methyltransferase [Nitrospira sp.]